MIPKIGVSVIIFKEDKVLLGKRKGSLGDGTWSLPGGHLEPKETVIECAKREVLEETGLIITDVKHFTFTDDFFEKEQKRYLTLFVSSLLEDNEQEVILKEPEKCECWKWFSLNKPSPTPLYKPLLNLNQTKFAAGFEFME